MYDVGNDKLNCWEILECGKQPGGENVGEAGPCPAATDESLDGMNHGKNGGRICWTVEDTQCEGCFAEKMPQCVQCEVYKTVQEEEGDAFLMYPSEAQKAKAKV